MHQFARAAPRRASLLSAFLSHRVPPVAGRHGAARRFNASESAPGAPPDAESVRERNKRYAVYAVALAVAVGGMSYAAVPLYKVFCQATGYGGTTQKASEEKFKSMKPVVGARQITVNFNADVAASMPWSFKPQQRSVKVVPGETALAFYTAHNPTDKPVMGVSTYNITPMRAGLYFNKIQCFCFEEQRLRPHEEIDMPVFFFVDPAFLDDPAMDSIKQLTLSYTFFRTGEQEVLTAPAGSTSAPLDGRPMGRVVEADGEGVEALKGNAASERIKRWTEEVASKTGVKLHGNAAMPSPLAPSS